MCCFTLVADGESVGKHPRQGEGSNLRGGRRMGIGNPMEGDMRTVEADKTCARIAIPRLAHRADADIKPFLLGNMELVHSRMRMEESFCGRQEGFVVVADEADAEVDEVVLQRLDKFVEC